MAIELLTYGLVKDVIVLAWRSVRGQRPWRTLLPAEPVAKSFRLPAFPTGFSIPLGWRGVLLDHDEAQADLTPGAYRARRIGKLRRLHSLSGEAAVIVWPVSPVRISCRMDGVFSADQHEFTVTIEFEARAERAEVVRRLPHGSAPTLTDVERAVVEEARPLVRTAVEATSGESIHRREGPAGRIAESALGAVNRALAGFGYSTAKVERVSFFNEAFDCQPEPTTKGVTARQIPSQALVRSRSRGALKQALSEDAFAALKRADEFEMAARVLEHDAELRERAYRGELDQADLDLLLARVAAARRFQEALHDAVCASLTQRIEASRLRAEVSRLAGSAAGLDARPGVPASYRDRVRHFLEATTDLPTNGEDLARVLRDGIGVAPAVLDPFRPIYGIHTLTVGGGWRVFDGESLWTISLQQIQTRRAGFLWLRRAPARGVFEARTFAGARRIRQVLDLSRTADLAVGDRHVNVSLTSGSDTEVTVSLQPIES